VPVGGALTLSVQREGNEILQPPPGPTGTLRHLAKGHTKAGIVFSAGMTVAFTADSRLRMASAVV
jgi:hypothetical protein